MTSLRITGSGDPITTTLPSRLPAATTSSHFFGSGACASAGAADNNANNSTQAFFMLATRKADSLRLQHRADFCAVFQFLHRTPRRLGVVGIIAAWFRDDSRIEKGFVHIGAQCRRAEAAGINLQTFLSGEPIDENLHRIG